jgi:type II secretory pathway component PulJ
LILLELLIALSLTAILLTILFSFFVETAKLDKKIETARQAIMDRNYLQVKLQTLFSSIDRSANAPYFYTQELEKEKTRGLVTIFDNGIDPDPAFSGTIQARLYLDENQNLCLTTQPFGSKTSHTSRKEILFPHVEHIEFEFLGKKRAPETGKQDDSRSINAAYAWRHEWSKTEREIPGIIRLTLQEKPSAKPIQYAFILPTAEPMVTYLKRGIAI